MNLQRRARALASGKSPSLEALKRTYNRAILNGGVTQDFSANVENIREISRKLGYNILKTPVQRNLLQYSEQFNNAIWFTSNSTISANTTTAPNGTLTADSLLETTANINHYVSLTSTITVVSGAVYTASAYLKSNGRQWANLGAFDVAGHNTYFDLTNGVVGNTSSVISASIQDAGNGWWRCSVTFTVSGTSLLVSINTANSNGNVTYIGDVTKGAYVWGAQLEQGSIMTKYQPTETTPIDGDYTNANFLYVPSSYGEGKNFAQVHNKRNLLAFSEDLTQSIWTKPNSTITSNAIIAPDGTLTADKLVETATNTTHIIIQSGSNVGINYTLSVFLKAGERTWSALQIGSSNAVYFDIQNGIIGNILGATTANIIAYPNGWYRCSMTAVAVGTS